MRGATDKHSRLCEVLQLTLRQIKHLFVEQEQCWDEMLLARRVAEHRSFNVLQQAQPNIPGRKNNELHEKFCTW